MKTLFQKIIDFLFGSKKKTVEKSRLQIAFDEAKKQWTSKGAILPQIILTDHGIASPGGLNNGYAFTYPEKGIMTINISTDWKNFSNGVLMQILLHEIGHAVKGNWNHSKNPNDIMFESVDGKHLELTSFDLEWAK